MMTKPKKMLTKKMLTKKMLRVIARGAAERDVADEVVTLEDAEDSEPWRLAVTRLGLFLNEAEAMVFAKAYTEQVIALCKEY